MRGRPYGRPLDYPPVMAHVSFRCERCNQDAVRWTSTLKSKPRFCSKECQGLVVGAAVFASIRKPKNMRPYICESCGGRKDFASKQCVRCSPRTSPRFTPTIKTCPVCLRPFRVKKSHETKRTYCSKVCLSKGYAIRMVGSGNPNAHANNTGRPRAAARFRIRKDLNHDEIASAFEAMGCAVLDTHNVGRGFPDIIVCHLRVIRLVEIKNLANAYGRKGLSPNQIDFCKRWPMVETCASIEQAHVLVKKWADQVALNPSLVTPDPFVMTEVR